MSSAPTKVWFGWCHLDSCSFWTSQHPALRDGYTIDFNALAQLRHTLMGQLDQTFESPIPITPSSISTLSVCEPLGCGTKLTLIASASDAIVF